MATNRDCRSGFASGPGRDSAAQIQTSSPSRIFTPLAALAWTDRPAISFQFHPEFSAAFAKALIEKRYDIVPDPDAAIASLDAPNDNARVGGWIRRSWRQRHARTIGGTDS